MLKGYYLGKSTICLQKSPVRRMAFRSGWFPARWYSFGALFTAIAVSGLIAFGRIYAAPIEIDLGSPHTVTPQLSIEFSALNNTSIAGQTLSIDLAISKNEFVRVFTATSALFDVSLKLRTNGTNEHEFLQGTGFLVDSQGIAIPGFGVTGSASGHDLLTIGLFPLLKDENGTPNDDLPRPLDFFGIHFDLTFPDAQNPLIKVIGGEFTLSSDPGAPFGVGPGIPRDIVPDGDSTALFLTVILACLISMRAWVTSTR